MTSGEALHRLTEYFGGDGKAKYTPAVLEAMGHILDVLSEDDRGRVYERLIENESARFRISVKEIKAACQALGIAYHAASDIPSEEWTCDACGREFRYIHAASDEQKLSGLFDVCPRCGFQPNWTITIRDNAAKGHVSPLALAQYKKTREECVEKYVGDDKDPFYSPSKARAEMEFQAKAEKRRIVDMFAAMGDVESHGMPAARGEWTQKTKEAVR